MALLKGYLVDTSLIVLLVVGREDPSLISKHRRLSGYSIDDFALLEGFLAQGEDTFVTANVLTETSNLLGQHGEPERSRLLERLRSFILETHEVFIASATAAANSVFARLGLTDAALLEAVSEETPLLTADIHLYLAAASRQTETVVNFLHFRRS